MNIINKINMKLSQLNDIDFGRTTSGMYEYRDERNMKEYSDLEYKITYKKNRSYSHYDPKIDML